MNQIKTIDFQIKIKLHPSLNKKKLKEECKDYWSNNFIFIDGDFNEILANSEMLIGSTSSTLMESLARGIPVAVIGSRTGITQNPIPDSIRTNNWTLCYSSDELASLILHYLHVPPEEKTIFEKNGKELMREYFTPITKREVSNFLDHNHAR